MSHYRISWASTEEDYSALRRLNHEVFARELGQYAETEDGCLVDRFESTSRLLLAWRGGILAGMVALRGEAPFSIEQRLEDPSVLHRLEGKKLEVRLLAIRPEERSGMLLANLLGRVLEAARAERWSWLLISGLRERQRFYERLGFTALGPAVQSGNAWYTPMAMNMASIPEKMLHDYGAWRRRLSE